MPFSNIYKSPRSPLAKLRHQSPATVSNASSEHDAAPAVAHDVHSPDWVNEEYADLLSRDKVKQKEAVKRYLAAKIRNDWVFTWPPASLGDTGATASVKSADTSVNGQTIEQDEGAPTAADQGAAITTEQGLVQDEVRDDDGYQVDESEDEDEHLSVQQDDTDNVSLYSIVSEDPLHYRPRMDWTSDVSDSEPIPFSSPFRAPDELGPEALAAAEARKAKHRREAREEAKWNEGLACFEARRNAWTGARTVRIKSKPVANSASPKSPKRFFFRRSTSSSPPAVSPATAIAATTASQTTSAADTSAVTSDASSAAANEGDKLRPLRTKDSVASAAGAEATYPVQTLIPLAPPILPPENCLRASINPTVYITLYEKVILSSLQPSCPINLSDMIRSCVVGWQRDGEWPPRAIMSISQAQQQAQAEQRRKKAEQQKAKEAKKQAKRMSNAGVSDGSNVARRMSLGLLGGGGGGNAEKEKVEDASSGSKAGKGFRRSIQKAFGFGSGVGYHYGEGTAVK